MLVCRNLRGLRTGYYVVHHAVLLVARHVHARYCLCKHPNKRINKQCSGHNGSHSEALQWQRPVLLLSSFLQRTLTYQSPIIA